jgi:hypothetical protein
MDALICGYDGRFVWFERLRVRKKVMKEDAVEEDSRAEVEGGHCEGRGKSFCRC